MKLYRMGQWGYMVYRHARHYQMRRAENLVRNYPHNSPTSPAIGTHKKALKITNQDATA